MYNHPLNFDTGRATHVGSVLSGATTFNQPLLWDTSSVSNMMWMLSSAAAFNHPLDFDVTGVLWCVTLARFSSSLLVSY